MDVVVGREWVCDGDHLRTSVIHRRKVAAISFGGLHLLYLRAHGRRVLLANRDDFSRTRPYLYPAGAVETDSIHLIVVDPVVVDVVDNVDIDVIYGAVVVETIAVPIAALVAVSGVAEAVIDAAVVADVASPESKMPAVAVALVIVSPVARSPERTGIRRHHPSAGNPVIAVGGVVPVAGGPDVAVAGAGRLVVLGQRRRSIGGVVGRLIVVVVVVIVVVAGLIGGILFAGVLIGLLGWRTGLGRVGDRRDVGISRIVGWILRGSGVAIGSVLILIVLAPGGEQESGREQSGKQESRK